MQCQGWQQVIRVAVYRNYTFDMLADILQRHSLSVSGSPILHSEHATPTLMQSKRNVHAYEPNAKIANV
jgi:hypothetical protein